MCRPWRAMTSRGKAWVESVTMATPMCGGTLLPGGAGERLRARNVVLARRGRRRVETAAKGAADDAENGGCREVHGDHLQRRGPVRERHAGGHRRDLRRPRRVRRGRRQGGRAAGRRRPAAGGHGHDGARARWRAAAHRRPLRGDQGAARRLLHARVQGPRRGARLGGADPRGQDRCGGGAARDGLRRGGLRELPRGGHRVLTGPQHAVLDRLFRRESGQAVAVLARVLGDLDRAEEAVQDAFLVALERWPARGVPENPAAWIVTAARNRAIDRIRSERRWADRRAALEAELRALGGGDDEDAQPVSPIPDDRLRLIFTTCHPALSAEARVALTLRALGGLTTAEVARAFLVSEAAMAQRITRAKAKIAGAGIRYEVPRDVDLPARLQSVLATVYLVFNAGYGPPVRAELCAEAIRLGRVLVALMPDEGDALALLALMLLQDSRRGARVGADGRLVLLPDQDRALWDRAEIAEGMTLVARAWRLGRETKYLLQATIAAEHARGETSDWGNIAYLYDRLLAVSPSPIVALNRAVAIAELRGPQAGLELMDELFDELGDYHLLHASRAALLRRLGRTDEARAAYREALARTDSPVERDFLERQLT